MGIAFSKIGNFLKIYNPSELKVYISKAIHETNIKVTEEVTEVAAVTAIGMAGVTSSPESIPVFKLDHPVIYSIIEKQTGVVIFLGTIFEP